MSTYHQARQLFYSHKKLEKEKKRQLCLENIHLFIFDHWETSIRHACFLSFSFSLSRQSNTYLGDHYCHRTDYRLAIVILNQAKNEDFISI